MVDGDCPDQNAVRAPTRADLVRICRELNQRDAKYIVLGGMALIEMGLDRGTMDIDFLVDKDDDNVARICDAISLLPDGAAREVKSSDVAEYNVVRIHDDIIVDLMGSACGIEYAEAAQFIDWREIEGVRIPFASIELLWKTKQTYRDKDMLDRAFLRTIAADMKRQGRSSGYPARET